jgi:hypothetical protein
MHHASSPLNNRTLGVGVAIAILSSFFGCHKDDNPVQAQTSAFVADFDSLWNRFDKDYSYFEYKHVDWHASYVSFRPSAQTASSMNDLVEVLQSMLSPLRDGHVWLIRPDSTLIRTYLPGYQVNYDSSLLAQFSATYGGHQMTSGWGSYWRIDSIPYIQLTTWYPPLVTISDFHTVLELYKNSPGLILDVRMNHGGSDLLAFEVAGRFTTAPVTARYYQIRNGPLHTDLTPMTPLIVNPSGSWQFQKPVVVLVGRGCASANEGFISAMREISTVTVVGDTTEGSDGNPEIRSLSNGWMYSVSTWIAYTADKKVIERNGIPPDIYVGASSSDFASRRDPVLEFGLQILRQKIAGNSN